MSDRIYVFLIEMTSITKYEMKEFESIKPKRFSLWGTPLCSAYAVFTKWAFYSHTRTHTHTHTQLSFQLEIDRTFSSKHKTPAYIDNNRLTNLLHIQQSSTPPQTSSAVREHEDTHRPAHSSCVPDKAGILQHKNEEIYWRNGLNGSMGVRHLPSIMGSYRKGFLVVNWRSHLWTLQRGCDCLRATMDKNAAL